jgi:tetratricopeptide (TPR) repeat protein
MAVVLSLAGVVRAEPERAQQALQHYKDGMAHFQLEEWDRAIAAWEAGFRSEPKPEFLYNIAQAYRLSHRPERALSFYQKYLRMSPDAANRAEVERHIASLQPIVDQQKSAASAPPTGAMPASATAPPTATTTTQLTASAPRRQPVYKKGWFWGVMGGVAIVAAGAITLGVVLGGSSTTNGAPVSFR